MSPGNLGNYASIDPTLGKLGDARPTRRRARAMAPVDPDIAASAGSANLHTVFTSECQNPQFDWFSLGVYASFRNAQMRGSITRLLVSAPVGRRCARVLPAC